MSVSLAEIGKVWRGKSIPVQVIISVSLLGSSYYSQRIYSISLHTKPNSSTLTVKAQSHKDLMEYIDLAHAASGFVGVVGLSTKPKLLSSLQGQMAVIIHFERDISHLAQAGTTFPLVEGWS